MRRPAFTLVELLVALATIAILIAVALPAIAGARESARRAACMVNLKSLSTAAELYRSKQGNVLPWTTRAPDLRAGRSSPLGELSLYLDAPIPVLDDAGSLPSAPWRCPSDRETAPSVGWSYVYFPTDLMNYYEFRSSAPGLQATRYFDERPEEPILAEADAFHARSRQHARRLVATLDGAVSEATQ